MVSTDPISDMFSRIRNAALVNKAEVSLPHSKIKEDVARILVKAGFLRAVNVDETEGRKYLSIEIAGEDQPSTITFIKRVSRPGKRVYVQSKEIPTIRRGRGIVVLSTSQGVMTGNEAAAKKLGGELICELY
jgi:small subunit ribosomal protein S8